MHFTLAERWRRAAQGITVLLGASLLGGCFSPSLYQAPRTVARGEFAGALGLEATNGLDAAPRPIVRPSLWPSLVMVGRYGLANRVELSASVLLITSASGALMAKFHVLRTEYFDIALMPRLSGGWFQKTGGIVGGCTLAYCDGTLHIESSAIALFGFNLGPDVTLMAAPGIVQSLAPERERSFRLSIGVQVRVSKELAIHPEVTYMPAPLGLSSATGGWFGGFGFAARGNNDGYAK